MQSGNREIVGRNLELVEESVFENVYFIDVVLAPFFHAVVPGAAYFVSENSFTGEFHRDDVAAVVVPERYGVVVDVVLPRNG